MRPINKHFVLIFCFNIVTHLVEVEIHLNASMEEPAVLEACMQLSPELTSGTCSGSLGYAFSPVTAMEENMPRAFGLLYVQRRGSFFI